MRLENKICVITGAGTGMGRALALQLALKENIAGLAICDVNEKELKETARLAGANTSVKIHTQLVDVSNRVQVEEWRDKVVEEFGGCDLLFNNAGINANGKMVYGPNDDVAMLEKGWDRCFNIDFYGVLFCIRAFLPVLISRKEAYLINTASVNSFFTWAEHTAYTAAKHAVKGLSDSLMLELKIKAPHVKIAVLHPGGVKTQIASNMLDPKMNQSQQASNAFAEIADLTSEDAASWIIGAVKKDQYRVLVGYDAILIDKMMRFMPTKAYSFYEQLGREGFNSDLLDVNSNSKMLKISVLLRLLFAGLWTNILFLWPMVILKMRHYWAGRIALGGLGGLAVWKGLKTASFL